MKNYSTLAALFAVAALSAPIVAQAQDPATAYKKVLELVQAGKGQDAINLCDQIIARYGKAESRMGKQFFHMVPFFIYQKADILFRAKKYAEAYEAYKLLADNPKFNEETYKKRAREIQGNPNGYDSLLSLSKFYKGYCLFQLAVGDPLKNVAGDPSKFEDAIKDLQVYKDLYTSGKVSKAEKDAGLDGSLNFLLMQAYLLKAQPDIDEAKKCLEAAKGKISDDMAMSGLASVVKAVEKQPENIDLCGDIVKDNPGSFRLGALRMAPYGGNMLQYGAASVKIGKTFLAAGNTKKACDAFRSAIMFFGLVPDSQDVLQNLNLSVKIVKSGKRLIPDKPANIKHNPATYKTLQKNYKGYTDSKQYMDSYATLQMANVGYLLGSRRIMKAGYQVIIDRYPDMQMKQPKEEGSKETVLKGMYDQNLSQLAALNRQTGDVEKAQKYEGAVNVDALGGDARISIIANRMSEALSAQNWEAVVPEAEEIMKILSNEKQSVNYISAKMALLSAKYKIAVERLAAGDYSSEAFEEVIKLCDDFIKDADGCLASPELTPENKKNYMSQARFFKLHSYHEMPTADVDARKAAHEACSKASQEYIAMYQKDGADEPDESIKGDDLAANVYYFYIDSQLKLQTIADNEAIAKGQTAGKENARTALKLCEKMSALWPKSKLAPVCSLISGQILIGVRYEQLYADDPLVKQIADLKEKSSTAATAKDKKAAADKAKKLEKELEAKAETQMDQAVVWLEKTQEQALAGEEKDYHIAAEALYQLYSYIPTCPRKGETDEARKARAEKYNDTFWTAVYPHMKDDGCVQALKLSTTALKRAGSAAGSVKPEDEAAKKAASDKFEDALKRVREVVTNESIAAMKSGKVQPEIEKSVNTYYSTRAETYAKLGTATTKDQLLEHYSDKTFLTNATAAGCKYTAAVLKLRRIRVLQEEVYRVETDKEMEANKRDSMVQELKTQIRNEMRDYDKNFATTDLSNYICREIGDYFLDEVRDDASRDRYSEENLNRALKYYSQIIERGGEAYDDGRLGKAKLLAYSKNAAQQNESEQLFKELMASRNAEVSSSARVGVTRLYAAKGDHKNVIATAADYVNRIPAKAGNPESVEMHQWYADALAATGNVDKALQICMSAYNNNMGSVSVSAPFCLRLLNLYEKRNKPASGDRRDNSFRPSDLWLAWNTGRRYVMGLEGAKNKMSPEQKAEFDKVEAKVRALDGNGTVQAEERANKEFARNSK